MNNKYLPIFIGVEILACIMCINWGENLGALGWGAYALSNLQIFLKEIKSNDGSEDEQ
jgi:hypothetical protein